MMSKKKGSRSSRRRRRRRRWTSSKVAYPSPAERERMIERRDALLKELIAALVAHPDDRRRIDELARRYGAEEVARVLNSIQTRSGNIQFAGDEITVYRQYRRAFARFGGDRPLLSAQEYDELILEYVSLHAKRTFKSLDSGEPSPREREMKALLLSGVDLWEDITPPAVPLRPPDFDAPAPGNYELPVMELLEWGWDLDEQRVASSARNVAKWRSAIPDLVRMVLDDGLLNGWPGEAASWAPYHALHMLGELGAHEVAGQLLALFDQDNDWLSDRLPGVWGQMGPQAEPPMWDYLDDKRHDPQKRGIVMLGLVAIAEANPEQRRDLVDELAYLLRHATADDATASAYIVHVLGRLEAVEATEVIAAAFEQGKVDESVVAPYSVDLLDWQE